MEYRRYPSRDGEGFQNKRQEAEMKILFLCTHNACRSILCEAIARDLANGRIEVASAGSKPSGEVHRQTLRHLEKRSYPTANLHSKGFDDVADFKPDAVITVCDQAAKESCPIWLGSAIKAHWGLPDPTRQLSATKMEEMFGEVIITIERRIKRLLTEPDLNLPNPKLDGLLKRIGEDNHGIV